MAKNRDKGECNSVRAELAAYIDGELPHDRARLVAEHVEACPECGAELERIRAAWAVVGGAETETDDRLRDRIWAEMSAERPARIAMPRWKIATALASMIVVISITNATCRLSTRVADPDAAAILAASAEEIVLAEEAALLDIDFFLQCDMLDDPQLLDALGSL